MKRLTLLVAVGVLLAGCANVPEVDKNAAREQEKIYEQSKATPAPTGDYSAQTGQRAVTPTAK